MLILPHNEINLGLKHVSSYTHTVVKCLKTVCDERMLQEPSTTCSGAFGSHKFPVSVRTQLEIREGQRFNNFVKDLPAYLNKNVQKHKQDGITGR